MVHGRLTGLPDRPPTSAEVMLPVLTAATAASSLHVAGSVAWDWLAVGFLATTHLLGPVRGSATATEIGAWFERLRPGTWLVAFLLVLVSGAVVADVVALPASSVTVQGGDLCAGVFGLVHLHSTGEMDGAWSPPREG